MAAANGYILILPTDRHALFTERTAEGMPFAEPVPEFSHSRNAPLLCFILTEDLQITHLARAKRGVRAGTDLRRLNIKDAIELETEVAASLVADNVPNRFKHWSSERLHSGGLLSPKAFSAIVDFIIRIVPSSAGILRRFSQERDERIAKLSSRTRNALAAQQMAVTTAMSLSGLSRDILLEWDPGQGSRPSSFLDGLPTLRLREDAMVAHDLFTLPGYDLIKSLQCPAAVFESDTCRLTVILANKLPLEEQTGTDLIYFNEKFRSFVMVQYKAMERENTEVLFRLPNAQLSTEIERMLALQSKLTACGAGPSKDEFRLSDNPFYLKLCSRFVFNPDDASLIPGMYLPLDYLERLSNDPSIEGPKGGKAISFRNVGRYLENNEFVLLVAKSWIGTTVNQSNFLADVIRTTLETGKAVAIGIKTDLSAGLPIEQGVGEKMPFSQSDLLGRG